ncbi:MAG: hypothetical protein ACSLE1_03420 [Sphingobium sp.]
MIVASTIVPRAEFDAVAKAGYAGIIAWGDVRENRLAGPTSQVPGDAATMAASSWPEAGRDLARIADHLQRHEAAHVLPCGRDHPGDQHARHQSLLAPGQRARA